MGVYSKTHTMKLPLKDMRQRWVLAGVVFCLAMIGLILLLRWQNNEPRVVKHRLQGGYEIWEIFNLLTPAECKELMRYAEEKGLGDSYVWSYDGSSQNIVDTTHRKSKQAWLDDQEHPIAMKLALYSEKLTGIPRNHQEQLQVARYDPLGKFNDHYDACDYGDAEYCAKMNNNSGERRSTLLVYLNTDFTGGETEFPLVGFKSKPQVGKAILFWNVDENDKIIWQAKHRGNQVIGGNKWIATKWSHSKPYNVEKKHT